MQYYYNLEKKYCFYKNKRLEGDQNQNLSNIRARFL